MILDSKITKTMINIINFLLILNDLISKKIHPIQIYGKDKNNMQMNMVIYFLKDFVLHHINKVYILQLVKGFDIKLNQSKWHLLIL